MGAYIVEGDREGPPEGVDVSLGDDEVVDELLVGLGARAVGLGRVGAISQDVEARSQRQACVSQQRGCMHRQGMLWRLAAQMGMKGTQGCCGPEASSSETRE